MPIVKVSQEAISTLKIVPYRTLGEERGRPAPTQNDAQEIDEFAALDKILIDDELGR